MLVVFGAVLYVRYYTLQNAQNFTNWKTAKSNELYNAGITNAANTANMNDLYNYYDINPQAAGRVEWGENGRDLYKNDNPDRQKAYLDAIVTLKKNLPGQEITNDLINNYLGNANQNTGNQTVGMNEAANNELTGYSGSNVQITREGKQGGEQIKKWAMPFYSGKMGA